MNEEDSESSKQEIQYDFKHLPEDLTLLQQEHYKDYCQKQCLKMCYYLQKVRQIEVLQMKLEFLKDENNNIWLSYVKDIQIRKVLQKQPGKSIGGFDAILAH